MRFVRESMSNRLHDEQSAIVVIMQRLHEGDVSGAILTRESPDATSSAGSWVRPRLKRTSEAPRLKGGPAARGEPARFPVNADHDRLARSA